MLRALYTAASGMEAQQLNIDTIAHNLANVNTTGFKLRRAHFQDLLYQTIPSPAPSVLSSISSYTSPKSLYWAALVIRKLILSSSSVVLTIRITLNSSKASRMVA